MTHDHKRNGTTTLFAALNVLDGTVIGRNMQRHRHQEFIRFLNAVEALVPAGPLIHAIVDNYATRKRPKVRAWLANHPRWTFHQPLRRGEQCQSQALRLDRRPQPNPRRRPARETSVRVYPLARIDGKIVRISVPFDPRHVAMPWFTTGTRPRVRTPGEARETRSREIEPTEDMGKMLVAGLPTRRSWPRPLPTAATTTLAAMATAAPRA
jgi:hypothetical protein